MKSHTPLKESEVRCWLDEIAGKHVPGASVEDVVKKLKKDIAIIRAQIRAPRS